MWLFYALALPVALAMVVFTLQYFASPTVSLHVKLIVGYAWFCTIAIIILVPADIWKTLSNGDASKIGFLWGWSYWSTFILTWIVVPLLQGFEDAGDFSVGQRIKTSIKGNVILYSSVGVVGFVGVVVLIIMGRLKWDGVMGLAMACSNTFGLVTGAFLLGFGLVSVPRSLWRNADLQFRQKWLSHKVVRVAEKLDIAHTELSTAIVIAQATSNQMSRRDPMRMYMDVIDHELQEMVREDPNFKPSGGRMGESDMDYDTDETSMAELRRRLKKCKETYTRYRSEYISFVREALDLEDTVKNANSSDRRFVSSFRPTRVGPFAPMLDTLEWIWRCRVRHQAVRILALVLAIMSVAIIAAEATLLLKHDLSLFSRLINALGDEEMSVQIVAFFPLVYMCICTYYSLVRLGMYTLYYLSPSHTNSVSLLMICSMVARYAAPLAYNYLSLIHLPTQTTFENVNNSACYTHCSIFMSALWTILVVSYLWQSHQCSTDGIAEAVLQKMGKMQVLPFLGHDLFQKGYPLFMVIYTGLLASNIFPKLVEYVGGWKRFRVEHEQEHETAVEGFDPSGVMILKKERTGLEQGGLIGDNVVPLARHFGNVEPDLETQGNPEEKLLQDKTPVGLKVEHEDRSRFVPSTRDQQSSSTREGIAAKYAAMRENFHKADSSGGLASNVYKPQTAADNGRIRIANAGGATNPFVQGNGGGLKNAWGNTSSGGLDMQTNIVGKRFAPLRNIEEREPTKLPQSSADTLDNIFQGLKRKPDQGDDMDLLR